MIQIHNADKNEYNDKLSLNVKKKSVLLNLQGGTTSPTPDLNTSPMQNIPNLEEENKLKILEQGYRDMAVRVDKLETQVAELLGAKFEKASELDDPNDDIS
jgi:hypothetical protein